LVRANTVFKVSAEIGGPPPISQTTQCSHLSFGGPMNTRIPDFVTVDLRGLNAALVSCAQTRRESVSVLVRRAVARELGQSESVPQLVVDSGCLAASPMPRVKLSI
jgi:hypothetical protein